MIEIGISFLLLLAFLGLLALCLGVYGLIRVARLCWASFKLGYRQETLRQLEVARDEAEGARPAWMPLDPKYATPRVTYTAAAAPDEFFDEHVTITDED